LHLDQSSYLDFVPRCTFGSFCRFGATALFYFSFVLLCRFFLGFVPRCTYRFLPFYSGFCAALHLEVSAALGPLLYSFQLCSSTAFNFYSAGDTSIRYLTLSSMSDLRPRRRSRRRSLCRHSCVSFVLETFSLSSPSSSSSSSSLPSSCRRRCLVLSLRRRRRLLLCSLPILTVVGPKPSSVSSSSSFLVRIRRCRRCRQITSRSYVGLYFVVVVVVVVDVVVVVIVHYVLSV